MAGRCDQVPRLSRDPVHPNRARDHGDPMSYPPGRPTRTTRGPVPTGEPRRQPPYRQQPGYGQQPATAARRLRAQPPYGYRRPADQRQGDRGAVDRHRRAGAVAGAAASACSAWCRSCSASRPAARSARRRARRSGEGMALAGIITGAVAVVLEPRRDRADRRRRRSGSADVHRLRRQAPRLTAPPRRGTGRRLASGATT